MRRAPIVAVTVDGGGDGGTTVALGIAAALARQGHSTAVVLEPGVIDGQLGEHVPETTGDWAVLDSPGAGRLEAATRHDTKLRQQLRAAQERADVVVVDPTGTSARGVRLPVDADVSLVIAPEKSVWGAWLWSDYERLDHRPAEVRMAAWLSEGFESFARHYRQVHPPTRTEELLQFLDERFTLIAADRSSEASAEFGSLYSDVQDEAEVLEEWWDPNSSYFECDPSDTLPPEREVPDSWRTEFLQQLAPEGRQRCGPAWEIAAAAWPARSRARHQLRLHPTALDPEKAGQIRRAFLQHVAAEATEKWGELWPGHGQTWADAEARGEDLTAGWEGNIETRIVPRTPDAVAAHLASVLAKSSASSSPAATTVLVRNKVRREDRGSAEQLEEVSSHLAPAGITALCEIPSNMTIRQNVGRALLTPKPALAAPFDRMAGLVAADCLNSSAQVGNRHGRPSTDTARTDQEAP
ncbi:hypothetical protein WKI65_43515 [Streptomyces sp. MS1.AVA.3]|uniref:hypothetical protein n=1 Tax=Streptomyces decoyicus TaxID=249567 RepID=UPI0030BACE3B